MCAADNRAGQDAPVLHDEDDRYGFVSVADGLAASLLALSGEGGCVTGIEGRWGAGKTSLLNLLLARLERSSPAGTHVLRFSPWLSGPGGNLAETLLLPVADIIKQEEERRQPAPQGYGSTPAGKSGGYGGGWPGNETRGPCFRC